MEPETTALPEKRKRGRPKRVPLAVVPSAEKPPLDFIDLPPGGTKNPTLIAAKLREWNKEHPGHKADRLVRTSPIPSFKPKKQRSKRSAMDTVLANAMKRLRFALDGFGPSSTEMLKVAALSVIQTKLDEITQLLRAVVPDFQPNQYDSRPEATPQSRTPMTLANIDRLDGRARVPINGPTCQICGFPSVYKTKRGMTLCAAHRPQGIKDDQDDKLQAMMAQGFGKGGGSGEEVIHVDDGTIKAALVAEGGETE